MRPLFAVALAGCALACSSGGGSEIGPGSSGGPAQGGKLSLGGSIGQGGSKLSLGGSAGSDNSVVGGACATVEAKAELQPVYLTFAFDVSGSMGKGDEKWHDAKLKWEPVVAATRAFFESPASKELRASLTAFPADDVKCDMATYLSPDVPMMPLPSMAFGTALDAIRAADWRGGTPTLAVTNGVLSFIGTQRVNFPGRYVFVLVTDGYPQGCDADNTIPSVVSAVAAVVDEVPTYVIGVKNPPINGAPDTVSDLTAIAKAGGTDNAFFIDTGDPAQTNKDLQAAIDQIRVASVSCRLTIPAAPGGHRFEKDKVVVTHSTTSGMADLTYDPMCSSAQAWHYDDAAAPTAVVLCKDTCDAIQVDPSSTLSLQFTCHTVINIPK